MTYLALPLPEPIGPATLSEPRRAIDAAPRPLILVLAAEPSSADVLADLSAFLHLDVAYVPTIGALETALQTQHPVGLLVYALHADSATWSALAAVSRHDPGLAVMLVTGNPVASDGTARGQPLTNIFWLDQRPELRAITEFLFHAERRPAQAPQRRASCGRPEPHR